MDVAQLDSKIHLFERIGVGECRIVVRIDGKDYDLDTIVFECDGVLGKYLVINTKPLDP